MFVLKAKKKFDFLKVFFTLFIGSNDMSSIVTLFLFLLASVAACAGYSPHRDVVLRSTKNLETREIHLRGGRWKKVANEKSNKERKTKTKFLFFL